MLSVDSLAASFPSQVDKNFNRFDDRQKADRGAQSRDGE
jgi:hypothetical protein